MTETPTLIIGDCHGHHDRLEALLSKAGVADKDCTVMQLGDLGHFDATTRASDAETWRLVYKRELKVDKVLWGNHDRAVIDPKHRFTGYAHPDPEITHMMRAMEAEGRLTLAEAVHGWLVTHAGLAPLAIDTRREVDWHDAQAIADWLNGESGETIDAVSRARYGRYPFGGILWRDISEDLWDGVPQIFGHSASFQHVIRGETDQWYDIDIGGKGGPNDRDAECLAGIWLPSQEIVRVDMNQRSGE